MSRRLHILIPLLLAPIAFSSCRFGNFEKDPPGPGAAAGYYEMLVNPSVTMCATRPVVQPNGVTQDQTNCPLEPATHLDANIQYIFTNPVNLSWDSAHGFYFFGPNEEVDPNKPGILPVLQDTSGDLFLPYGPTLGPFSPMETHPECQVSISVSETGSISTGGVLNSGSDLPILGRISLNLTWDYSPIGDCSKVSTCYSDATQCSVQDQQSIKAIYEPFVDIGLLGVSDLSKVEKLEYQVSYQ